MLTTDGLEHQCIDSKNLGTPRTNHFPRRRTENQALWQAERHPSTPHAKIVCTTEKVTTDVAMGMNVFLYQKKVRNIATKKAREKEKKYHPNRTKHGKESQTRVNTTSGRVQ